jgi:copper transport protein
VEVDSGDAGVDSNNPERMTVSLPPLPDGIYIVSWQALSKTDGHVTAGGFPFAVGKVDTSSLPAEEQTTTELPISALIAKWLLLAAGALLVGQFPSIKLIWSPVLQANHESPELLDRYHHGWKNLFMVGLIAAFFACALGVLAQAGQTTGQLLAAPWSKETIQVLTGTRLGMIWLIRFTLVFIGYWMVQSKPTAWKEAARFILGLILLLTISLTSHAATEAHPALPILADWLHLVGMSFWFGGLAHLILGLTILQRTDRLSRTRIASAVTIRFSFMALPTVTVIGITGFYSAALRVGSVPALLSTLYGNSFLVKQALVAILLLIAGINFLVISPQLERQSLQNIPGDTLVLRFRRMVLVEATFACLLLASVSVLTYLPPARTLLPKTALIASRKVDDIKIALTVSPGLVGQNTFTVKLTPASSVEAVKSVVLTFVQAAGDIAPSEYELTSQGNGTYTGQAANIGFAGEWLIEVAVRRENKFDAIVTFDFDVTESGSASENKSSAMQTISTSLIVLLGVLFVIDLFTWWRSRSR